jgi:hypothetical protein
MPLISFQRYKREKGLKRKTFRGGADFAWEFGYKASRSNGAVDRKKRAQFSTHQSRRRNAGVTMEGQIGKTDWRRKLRNRNPSCW